MDVVAEYRWDKLKERLKEVENTLLGLNTPVSKMVCDETGLATDEKVQALADTVVFHQCNLNGKYIGIGGAEKRYYELLFYLVFRAYDAKDRVFCFEDFLEVAAEMKRVYKCREELILHDAEMIGKPLGFFRVIRESCKLLTGRILADDYTKEELEQLRQDYIKKDKIYERKLNERIGLFALTEDVKREILEKYKDYGIEGYDDYFEALEQRSWDIYEYLDIFSKGEDEFFEEDTAEEDKRREAKKEVWLQSFRNPQEYLNAYREFSELHFCVNVMEGIPNLQDAVFYILERNGFNKIRDDEKFESLYAELNRALRIAKRRYF